MTRVKILTEGKTEARFVQGALAMALLPAVMLEPVTAKTGTNPAGGSAKGGGRSWLQVRNELHRLIATEGHKVDVHFSTMLDLYALPSDTPGWTATRPAGQSKEQRVLAIEQAIKAQIGHPRFFPYIQLHEFEALLLVDPREIARQMNLAANAADPLVDLVSRSQPEEINETPEGAPSKRIQQVLPGYKNRKTTDGPIAAARIGLPRLRAACPHFAQWVDRLEQLA